jgi:xylulokinase
MISLGIDIGGTGCKCVAFSSSGQQLALAYKEYPLAAGTVNLPAEVLTESVFAVIAQCCSQIEDKTAIRVVTVSSFGESFVPVDEQGKALTDILMYFGNTESQAFTDLVEKVGPEKFMRIARILPDAGYSTLAVRIKKPTIRWL